MQINKKNAFGRFFLNAESKELRVFRKTLHFDYIFLTKKILKSI